MNANRKMNLQRKLALTPVPAPPAGLAERIKHEIPEHLRFDAEAERKSLAQSLRLSLRVAASILILTIGAYAMLHVLSRINEQKPVAITTERRAPAAKESVASAPHAAEAPAPAPPPAPANVARRKIEPPTTRGLMQPAAAPEAMTFSPAVAAQSKAADSVAVQPTRLDAEATVSPISGRTMLRVSVASAPDAKVDVQGARQLSTDLYAIEGERATIRLRYRRDGAEKTIERTIGRADVRPWSDASQEMRDAVMKAENPQR